MVGEDPNLRETCGACWKNVASIEVCGGIEKQM